MLKVNYPLMLEVNQTRFTFPVQFACPLLVVQQCWSLCLSVLIQPDDTNLYTGDAVVFGANTATVVIEANDDTNGIFFLEAGEKPVEEGESNDF